MRRMIDFPNGDITLNLSHNKHWNIWSLLTSEAANIDTSAVILSNDASMKKGFDSRYV